MPEPRPSSADSDQCSNRSSSTLFQHFRTVRVQINQSIVNHLFSVSLALLSSFSPLLSSSLRLVDGRVDARQLGLLACGAERAIDGFFAGPRAERVSQPFYRTIATNGTRLLVSARAAARTVVACSGLAHMDCFIHTYIQLIYGISIVCRLRALLAAHA